MDTSGDSHRRRTSRSTTTEQRTVHGESSPNPRTISRHVSDTKHPSRPGSKPLANIWLRFRKSKDAEDIEMGSQLSSPNVSQQKTGDSPVRARNDSSYSEACSLVRAHTLRHTSRLDTGFDGNLESGLGTRANAEYSASHGGVLAALLGLYRHSSVGSHSTQMHRRFSFENDGLQHVELDDQQHDAKTRPEIQLNGRSVSLTSLHSPQTAQNPTRHHKVTARDRQYMDEIEVTLRVAETLKRQRLVMTMTRALMAYGAPTHRLEEYINAMARLLDVDVHCLYLPGAMFLAFEDSVTHTTEVKLVKVVQGVDFGKLGDTYAVYKNITHDAMTLQSAIERLEEIRLVTLPYWYKWVRIPVFGLCSSLVGLFGKSKYHSVMPLTV